MIATSFLIRRRKAEIWVGVVVIPLFAILGWMPVLQRPSTFTWSFAVVLTLMGLALVFVGKRVELDFENGRFRIYTFRLLTTRSAFRPLPRLDHIRIRPVRYPVRRSGLGYWNNTYAYELSLMSVSREKLVLCVREDHPRILALADRLSAASGLRIMDVSEAGAR